jgi:hypothetical protein
MLSANSYDLVVMDALPLIQLSRAVRSMRLPRMSSA